MAQNNRPRRPRLGVNIDHVATLRQARGTPYPDPVAAAAATLAPPHRHVLADAGFRVESVALDAIEAGGGSLRCCIGEVF